MNGRGRRKLEGDNPAAVAVVWPGVLAGNTARPGRVWEERVWEEQVWRGGFHFGHVRWGSPIRHAGGDVACAGGSIGDVNLEAFSIHTCLQSLGLRDPLRCECREVRSDGRDTMRPDLRGDNTGDPAKKTEAGAEPGKTGDLEAS